MKKPTRKHQPISLHPLRPEDALSGLMQVKPPGREIDNDEDEQEKVESEPEMKEPS